MFWYHFQFIYRFDWGLQLWTGSSEPANIRPWRKERSSGTGTWDDKKQAPGLRKYPPWSCVPAIRTSATASSHAEQRWRGSSRFWQIQIFLTPVWNGCWLLPVAILDELRTYFAMHVFQCFLLKASCWHFFSIF